MYHFCSSCPSTTKYFAITSGISPCENIHSTLLRFDQRPSSTTDHSSITTGSSTSTHIQRLPSTTDHSTITTGSSIPTNSQRIPSTTDHSTITTGFSPSKKSQSSLRFNQSCQSSAIRSISFIRGSHVSTQRESSAVRIDLISSSLACLRSQQAQ